MDVSMKKSRQRDAILQCVIAHHDHPTADAVYHDVQKIYPNISLGTVYRNLALLSKIGKIRKIISDDLSDRYDGRVDPHAHFSCVSCGCVLDCDFQMDSKQIHKLQRYVPGQIIDTTLIFHGYCKDCIQKNAQLTIDTPEYTC